MAKRNKMTKKEADDKRTYVRSLEQDGTEASETPSSEILTAEQAAKFLKISRNTLYYAAGRGEIPHGRAGKRFVFSQRALLSWLGCGTVEKEG